MTADHITWFAFGSAATSILFAFASWLGGRLKDRADEYEAYIPLTRDELAARRERLAKSLTESVG